jgi:nucleotide-binding universal stress UspA family protein
MFKRILVPIDGSATANLGLREAVRLAKNQKAQLCLLHVVDEFFMTQAADGLAYTDEMFDALRDGGRKLLSRAETAVRKQGLKPRSVLAETLTGGVAGVIVQQAKKWKADLIVMGTHGRRGVRRVVMGSDAEQVLRTTRVPVLLFRAK